MTGVNGHVQKARLIVVAGLAAGSLTLLAASPAAAIGVRPVDPTETPASTAPLPGPGSPGAAPGALPPLPPQPAPPTGKRLPAEPIEYVWWW